MKMLKHFNHLPVPGICAPLKITYFHIQIIWGFSPNDHISKQGNPIYYVVYFDQQMGALHAVCWLKSFVSALKQVFLYFVFFRH